MSEFPRLVVRDSIEGSEAKRPSNEQIKEACTIWQERLRLQDWDIEVEVTKSSEIEGNQGLCTVSLSCKHALIKLSEENKGPNPSIAQYDMEMVLVHELLHIHFEAILPEEDKTSPINEMRIMLLEQAFCGIVPWMISVGRVIPVEYYGETLHSCDK